jgi:hypothetical protein
MQNLTSLFEGKTGNKDVQGKVPRRISGSKGENVTGQNITK